MSFYDGLTDEILKRLFKDDCRGCYSLENLKRKKCSHCLRNPYSSNRKKKHDYYKPIQ